MICRFFALAVCLVVTSCGGNIGTVKGVITYQNQPLANAMITFIAADGRTTTAASGPDGTYLAIEVPAGECRIGVVCFSQTAEQMAATAEDIKRKGALAKNPTNIKSMIPEKYGNPDTSGLSLNVKSGENQYPIALD